MVKKGLGRQRTKEVRNRCAGYVGKNVVNTGKSKCEDAQAGARLTTALPSPVVLLSTVSITHGQPRSENFEWKIPKIDNLYVLDCVPF